MPPVTLRPEAATELTEAIEWYESRASGLGSEFLRSFEATLASLQRNPRLHPTIFAEARCAALRRFPYGVIYVTNADAILIVACMHYRRHPRYWQTRL